VIPYVDLAAQYRSIKRELDEAVIRVLGSAHYILGPEVEQFERAFAEYCHVKEAVGVNSGTSALHLSLLACGVGTDDEVITVPFTFVATVSAILYAGAHPVFVDVEPRTLTMDPEQVERAITPRTKAIIPVHLYGQPADMDPILELARSRGLRVIEDAAQAHGAEYKGRRCGSLGDMAAFSFYPAKNLGACGEGGAVVTNDAALAQKVRLLRSWGEQRRYEHLLKAYNYRMDGIQGAILAVKLRHLERWTEARRTRAALYDRLLHDAPLRTPVVRSDSRHVYHCYVVRTENRDQCRQMLSEQQIQTGVHYPIPIHLQPGYSDLGYSAGDFPVAEAAASEVLSLPIFPEMTEGQVETVAAALCTPVKA
jgi:dTDP-4-amino-4,6-dideoxygalactose transaminase